MSEPVEIDRERLAEWLHNVSWAGWWQYMRGCGTETFVEAGRPSVHLGPRMVERWDRQAATPYSDLPESEKASDLKLADDLITLLRGEAE